jgi:hypothetical protein
MSEGGQRSLFRDRSEIGKKPIPHVPCAVLIGHTEAVTCLKVCEELGIVASAVQPNLLPTQLLCRTQA